MFKSRFLIFGGLVVLGVALFFSLNWSGQRVAQAQLRQQDLQGFWWSPNFGWISLNCQNDWNGDGVIALPQEERCGASGLRYGALLTLDNAGQGTVSGYAWSPNIGLICLGNTCSGAPPSGGSAFLRFDLNSSVNLDGVPVALLQGWGRVEGQRDEGGVNRGGWLQFSGATAQGGAVVSGVRQAEAEFFLGGSAWQVNPNGTGVGWIYLGNPPPPERALQGGGGGGEDDGEGAGGQANAGPPQGAASGSQTGLPARTYPARTEECGTSGDEDSDDGLNSYDANPLSGADCADYDCAGFYACPTQESAAQCFDGLDNDLDAYVWTDSSGQYTARRGDFGALSLDCADADCQGARDPASGRQCVVAEYQENTHNYCSDGLDNDGNGLTDCADALCAQQFILCNRSNLEEGHAQCARNELTGRCLENCPDPDQDQVCNGPRQDNCPALANAQQTDSNANGIGDACDAFLETRQGSIYAPEVRTGETSPGRPLATYCILTSGLAPLPAGQASCALSGVREFRLSQYPDAVALFARLADDTLRGRFDLRGLLQGRYGAVARVESGAELAEALRGRGASGRAAVLYRRGDLTLNENVTLPADRGPITVLLEGNLNFGPSARLSYGSSPAVPLRRVPSLAWIVVDNPETPAVQEGSLRIDPQLGQEQPDLEDIPDLVGAFFASNRLESGVGPRTLTIQGLLIARQFAFGRTWRATGATPPRGAELIIYDGRAVLNPPPGLADIVKTLPRFRTIAPR